MRRMLRWVGRSILLLVLVVAALFGWYRVRGPSADQRAVLALLEQERRPAGGRNAFPALWFLQYDVPESELEARMAADVAEVHKRLAAGGETIQFEPAAERLPLPGADDTALCNGRTRDCLKTVGADPAATRAALDKHARVLEHARAIGHYDHVWAQFPADYRAPMAAYAPVAQNLWLSSLALEFVDGRHGTALAGACANAGTWRRLRGGTNSLVNDMTSIVFGDRAMRLFAEMLAALPPDEPVPPVCGEAFRPVAAADVDRCTEFAQEIANTRSSMRAAVAAQRTVSDRAIGWLTFDAQQTAALKAEQFAAYCGDAAVRRSLADRAIDAAAIPRPFSSWRPECVANVTGCVLSEMTGSAYVKYDERVLDYAAHLRLAATLLWLRQPRADHAQLRTRFDQRPAELRSAGHISGIDLDQDVLFVENLDPRREQRFELRLPAAPATHPSPQNATP